MNLAPAGHLTRGRAADAEPRTAGLSTCQKPIASAAGVRGKSPCPLTRPQEEGTPAITGRGPVVLVDCVRECRRSVSFRTRLVRVSSASRGRRKRGYLLFPPRDHADY